MNTGLNILKITTLTLLSDLTVPAQEDVFHWGVKDETHILQKALFGKKRYMSLQSQSHLYILATFTYFRRFSIPTNSYSSMHKEGV